MNAAEYIEYIQKGKTGIYPEMVAMQVAIEFQIKIVDARQLVLQHIKNELKKQEGKT